MTDTNVIKLAQPGTFIDSLTEILRNGAHALLARAVELEVTELHWPICRPKDRGGPAAAGAPRTSAQARDHDRPRWARGRARAADAPPPGRGRAHSVQLGHPAALRAAHEEPRSADPDPVLERHLHETVS